MGGWWDGVVREGNSNKILGSQIRGKNINLPGGQIGYFRESPAGLDRHLGDDF